MHKCSDAFDVQIQLYTWVHREAMPSERVLNKGSTGGNRMLEPARCDCYDLRLGSFGAKGLRLLVAVRVYISDRYLIRSSCGFLT